MWREGGGEKKIACWRRVCDSEGKSWALWREVKREAEEATRAFNNLVHSLDIFWRGEKGGRGKW
jgi:hypothetical protein